MHIKRYLTIPAIIIAVLAVGAFAAPTVQAHDGVASGTCNGGVQWDYHNYDKTVVNSITVTIDGVVRYTDGDFKASDTGTIATDRTVVHTWDVAVNAPGTQFDRHPNGSYAACVVAPTTTTTTAASSTTVVVATTAATSTTAATAPSAPTTTVVTTTTSVVAVDIPPVPTLALIPPVIIAADASVEPALPVTGGGDEVAFIAIAAGLIAVGVYLVIRGRRVP